MNIIRTLPLGHNSFDRSKNSLILDILSITQLKPENLTILYLIKLNF